MSVVSIQLRMPVSVQSASSLPDSSNYRGGRKKEPPPPNMTPEQRLVWEQERDKKDKHNDSKMNGCVAWLKVVRIKIYFYIEPQLFYCICLPCLFVDFLTCGLVQTLR